MFLARTILSLANSFLIFAVIAESCILPLELSDVDEGDDESLPVTPLELSWAKPASGTNNVPLRIRLATVLVLLMM